MKSAHTQSIKKVLIRSLKNLSIKKNQIVITIMNLKFSESMHNFLITKLKSIFIVFI